MLDWLFFINRLSTNISLTKLISEAEQTEIRQPVPTFIKVYLYQ